MLTLLISRDEPTKPDSTFTVWIKGDAKVREQAACIDEAVGALVRKNYRIFRHLVKDARIVGSAEDYCAYLKNWAPDVLGYGYNADSAMGALIRLNPRLFKTTLILRGETNGPRKPR